MKLQIIRQSSIITAVILLLFSVSCVKKSAVEVHMKITPDFKAMEKEFGQPLPESDRNIITLKLESQVNAALHKYGCRDVVIKKTGDYILDLSYKTDNQNAVKNLFSEKPALTFRFADDSLTYKAREWYRENFQDRPLPEDREKQKDLASRIAGSIKLPADCEVLFIYQIKDKGNPVPSDIIILYKKASLNGNDISSADMEKDAYGQIVLTFITTEEGAARFAEVTGEGNHGKRLAVVFNNQVKAAPVIRETISSGRGNISGGFSEDDVKLLLGVFQSGMTIDVRIIEERETPVN